MKPTLRTRCIDTVHTTVSLVAMPVLLRAEVTSINHEYTI